MVQPSLSRNIPADFLTSNHYVLGQIKVSSSGMMGILADVNTSTLEVNDASIARIVKPDKVINYASSLYLAKNRVQAVCLTRREQIGSATLARGGYTRVFQYPVQLISSVYEVQGTLEWTGRFEFSALLNDGSNAFLVLYDTIVTASLFPALHIESPVMLFNRNFIDAVATYKKPGAAQTETGAGV